MDGYLTGATVCLDTNANLLCDSGEPTATSQAKGAWSFSVPAGTDTSKLHIIAVINANTIDADTGIAPQQGYTLLAPATAASVVTPLTTLVSHTLLESPGLTLAQAQAKAISDSNLPAGTKFDEDYVAKSNTSAHNVAKLIADVLGQSAAAVNSAALPSSDAEKATAIKEALTKAKGQVAIYAQQAANAGNATALQTLRTSAKAATKTAIESDTTILDTVKIRAQFSTAKLANLSSLLSNEGLFFVQNDPTCGLSTLCNASAAYQKVFASDSTHISIQTYYALKGNKTWTPIVQDSAKYKANISADSWVNNLTGNGVITLSNDGLNGVLTNVETNVSKNVSITEIDISNKNSKNVLKLLGNACSSASDTAESYICMGLLDFVFPATSKLFVNTFFQNTPEYTLWDCETCGLSIAGSTPKKLEDVIASANGNPNLVHFGGAAAKFEEADKKIFLFDYGQQPPTPLASGTYQIQTIANSRVLSINITSVQAPEKWFNNNDRDTYTLNYIWVERGGKILTGYKVDAGATTKSTYLNRTAADAIFKHLDYPATMP
jgi:hypothetical protein